MQRFRTDSYRAMSVVLLVTALGSAGLGAQSGRPQDTVAVVPQSVGQGPAAEFVRRGQQSFEAFQYEEAIDAFSSAIDLWTGELVPDAEGLVGAYELRTRARFAIGDAATAEADFARLLELDPGFTLGADISPRVVSVFDSVKSQTVGQLSLDMAPLGDVLIDGRPHTVSSVPTVVDLAVGDHSLEAARAGFQAMAQQFTIRPGEQLSLSLRMERVSSTLEVSTLPAGVEVFINGEMRGVTTAESGSETSAPLLIDDLMPGVYRLGFTRDCYVMAERQITIERPDDLRINPVSLEPAVATVLVEAADSDAMVYLDGEARGPAPVSMTDVCEGEHVIEVRSSNGRFVDRRTWRIGETVTLKANIRPAFALIPGSGDLNGEAAGEVALAIERAMADTRGMMLFVPRREELDTAYREAGVDAADPAAALQELSDDARRKIGQALGGRLGAQGIVGFGGVPGEQDTVQMMVLSAGSGRPDLLTVRLSNPASRVRVADRLSRSAPPIHRPSLDVSVVDVDAVQGAVIVRVMEDGASDGVGLSAGDVIMSFNESPVASVAEMYTVLASVAASRSRSASSLAQARLEP